MPTIPDRFDFEPNRDALQLWLFTRKGEKHYGMTDTPGFFTTEGFGKDQFWFVIALVLEMVGVSLLIVNGFSVEDSLFSTIAVIGAIAMLAADLFLAYKLHRNHGKKCYARNRAKVTDDRKEKSRILDELKGGRIGDIFIVMAMIIIALIKIGGIFLMGSFSHLAIVIALVFMFGIIVYVHVYHTGYYMYEWRTGKKFRSQYKKYTKPDEGTEDGNKSFEAKVRRSQLFYAQNDLLGIDKDRNPRSELHAHMHKITKVEGKEKEGKQAYEIETTGILLDEDIATFLAQGGLDGEQQSIIARNCLDHQLKIYSGKL